MVSVVLISACLLMAAFNIASFFAGYHEIDKLTIAILFVAVVFYQAAELSRS